MTELVDSMLDLMRRLPPARTEENVNALITICPDYADDLLGSVDQPLQLKTDHAIGRDYLACDYNRDGDSYRYVLNIESSLRYAHDVTDVDHLGRMNMIPHWMMELCPRRDYANSKLRLMKRLIPIVRCAWSRVLVCWVVDDTGVFQVL